MKYLRAKESANSRYYVKKNILIKELQSHNVRYIECLAEPGLINTRH